MFTENLNVAHSVLIDCCRFTYCTFDCETGNIWGWIIVNGFGWEDQTHIRNGMFLSFGSIYIFGPFNAFSKAFSYLFLTPFNNMLAALCSACVF